MIELNQFKVSGRGYYIYGEDQEGSRYDAKARLYEFLVSTNLYNRIAWGTSPNDYSDFAKTAIEKSSGSIIDIGCGGLTHTADLYCTVKNDLFLVDNSKQMIQIAQKRMENKTKTIPENIWFLQANALHLPFYQYFENLFSFGMLHLFDDKIAFLKSIFSTLKPGGRFFLSSLTTDRKISRKYIKLLQRNNEMGYGQSSGEIISMIKNMAGTLNCYVKGSMVFLYGTK